MAIQHQVNARAQARCCDDLAIASKLRGCDVVAIRVENVAAGGYMADRATARYESLFIFSGNRRSSKYDRFFCNIDPRDRVQRTVLGKITP
jgi:hypothetical protein